MSGWERVGSVALTQIHVGDLVHGNWYDVNRLHRVDALWLTARGVVGVRDGKAILDSHHRDHPERSRWNPGRMLSVGFEGHYARIAEHFGEVPMGIGGENLVVDAPDVFTESDLSAGMRIVGESGEVELAGAAVAKPCLQFTGHLLDDPDADQATLLAHRGLLDHGIRGFVFDISDLSDRGFRVAPGAEVFRRI